MQRWRIDRRTERWWTWRRETSGGYTRGLEAGKHEDDHLLLRLRVCVCVCVCILALHVCGDLGAIKLM
jgi:hypothetical protein